MAQVCLGRRSRPPRSEGRARSATVRSGVQFARNPSLLPRLRSLPLPRDFHLVGRGPRQPHSGGHREYFCDEAENASRLCLYCGRGRSNCNIFRDHPKVASIPSDARHQIGFSGILMRQGALPHHKFRVVLRCPGEGGIPLERPKTLLSAILVRCLHQLPGFHRLRMSAVPHTGSACCASTHNLTRLFIPVFLGSIEARTARVSAPTKDVRP